MSDLMLDVGQANELKMAFRRNDWTNDEVKRLSEGNLLAGIKAVLGGTAKIKPVSEDTNRFIALNETTIAVNLGAPPKLPFNGAEVEQHVGDCWTIVERHTAGLYVGDRKVILHLSNRQKKGKWHKGHELREELTGKPVLSANILDALLANPHLLPEDWMSDENGNVLFIFFWGTIFHDPCDHLYVRHLCFYNSKWCSNHCWIGGDWDGFCPAALRAS